jgi:hypothetical protein
MEKEKNYKRPAFRVTPNGDVHDIASVEWTIQRYGAITDKTRKKLCSILDKYKDLYEYKVFLEGQGEFVDLEPATVHYTFRCHRKGNIIEKFIDNERDALQTIENFKNNPPKKCE